MSAFEKTLFIAIIACACLIIGTFLFMAFHTTPGIVSCADGATIEGDVNVYWHDEMYRVETERGTVYAPKAICRFNKDR